jgi:hypothetical protein
METKFKEKHYKKSRFSHKSEKELADFKKEKIVQNLDEVKTIALENLSFQTELIKDKNKLLEFPAKNTLKHFVTQKQMNAFSFVISAINQFGTIDFLQLMSYTFDEKTIYSLNELLQSGKIKKLQIIMTETASFRIAKIYRLLKELFSDKENCNLVFCWVHSKIRLINANNQKYVIDGSGNFSMNAQIEHYNITQSNELYDFHTELSNNVFFGEKTRKNHEIYKNFEI